MTIFEKFILIINEFINIRTKQIQIYKDSNNNKEITPLHFKIKNYKKWIETINQYILNNINIVNKIDITNLNLTNKLTDKLTSYLIELFDTGKITELDKIRKELIELQESSKISSVILPVNEIIISTQLDTSKIESQPKILNGEVRPTDARGGAIFDLRYVHGIGPVSAIKLVDDGVNLEGLLSEWKEWVSKDSKNAILTLYKMPKPKQYTTSQWELLDKYKKYNILETNLKTKLISETKMLHKIHKSSLVGIKHFNDMSLKIPRQEIKTAESILKKLALHLNKDLLVMICGSYRRGRDKSGDVDCLIAHPLIKTKSDLENNPVNLLENFVELLMNFNFIIDQLDMGNKKFMGFCNIMQFIKKTSEVKSSEKFNNSNSNSNSDSDNDNTNNIARRIDIRIVPYESYGSAILYFTGSKTFNTNMRSHALKKGYSLNEFGLTKISDGTIIPCSTEEEIFKIINYPYKKPEDRDI